MALWWQRRAMFLYRCDLKSKNLATACHVSKFEPLLTKKTVSQSETVVASVYRCRVATANLQLARELSTPLGCSAPGGARRRSTRRSVIAELAGLTASRTASGASRFSSDKVRDAGLLATLSGGSASQMRGRSDDRGGSTRFRAAGRRIRAAPLGKSLRDQPSGADIAFYPNGAHI